LRLKEVSSDHMLSSIRTESGTLTNLLGFHGHRKVDRVKVWWNKQLLYKIGT